MRNMFLAIAALLLAIPVFGDETSDILNRNVGGQFSHTSVGVDLPFSVTLGKTQRFNYVSKFGYNPEIDAGQTEDVWGAGGDMVFLTSPLVIHATSSNAADSVGLTGATSITIEGLDVNHLEQSETLVLHGSGGTTFPVTTATFVAINRAYVATAGSGNTNAGAITIFADESGVAGPDSIQAYIIAGEAQTVQAIYTVPSNYEHAFVTDIMISYGRQGGPSAVSGDAQLMVRDAGSNVFKIKYSIAVTDASFNKHFDFPIRISPQSVVKVRAISSTNNSVVSATFDILLYDDDEVSVNLLTPVLR